MTREGKGYHFGKITKPVQVVESISYLGDDWSHFFDIPLPVRFNAQST